MRLLVKTIDILPALRKGKDSDEVWLGLDQSTFGGFLFHRSALLRRISAGFTSGLPGPRSCDKKTIHQTSFSRTELYGASGKSIRAAEYMQVSFVSR